MSGGADLLKLLSAPASAATQRIAGAFGANAAGSAAGPNFAELLAKARSGQVSSGTPVTIASGVNASLSQSQLARVATATDQAQAEGASHALVMMDGMALKVDIASRQVTDVSDAGSGQVMTGIDAVISVDSSGNASTNMLKPPTTLAGFGNASLRQVLAKIEGSTPTTA
jgi:hypothetical protein